MELGLERARQLGEDTTDKNAEKATNLKLDLKVAKLHWFDDFRSEVSSISACDVIHTHSLVSERSLRKSVLGAFPISWSMGAWILQLRSL